MLQINTGKLFRRGVGRKNDLAGVLYSNVRLPSDRVLSTAAGRLKSTGSGPADLALVYELEEIIEAQENGPGVLVSHTVGPFLDDFATVASFGLGAVFSRDPETIRYLTGGRPRFGSYDAPGKFVAQFFDGSIYLAEKQVADFEAFVTQLLALDRRTYLAAMRAMKTLTAGLHSIADDLPLAYTLLVSSTESLAQDFDEFDPIWSDMDETKRHAIDQALASAEPTTAEAVRSALLGHEHIAISRRFRAFMLKYVDGSYFRQTGLAGGRPVARFELEAAIKQAYNLRSGYVHRLSNLPTAISHPFDHWECVDVDGRPALTFQGLYRLTRHVVRRFIETGRTIELEPYNYTLEQAGVISMEMAPQYWVWRPLGDPSNARKRLEGMLSLAVGLLKGEKVELGDMRPVLSDVERQLPQSAQSAKSAMLLFHILTNWLLSLEIRSPGAESFLADHADEAFSPSPEAAIVGAYIGNIEHWPIDEHKAMIDQYFAERVTKIGFHAPRLFETAALLTLAEKFRSCGKSAEARETIARAVETHPGNEAIKAFEETWQDEPIGWRSILLPPTNNSELPSADL